MLKTYSHLSGGQRMPSEYELVTTNLLYYTRNGFEVDVPLKKWYEQYQKGSPLRCRDWEQFRDPRQTIYSSYTELQHQKETFVDGILQSIDDRGYDRQIAAAWLPVIERVLGPGRFLFHGLQMVAAYVGQMAPSGRITIASLFQAADELRRTQRFAYRLRQLQLSYPEFGAAGKEQWQRDPIWQPTRQALELLLTTYDWGEALVALNLCLKPLLDELLMYELAMLSRSHGDLLQSEILFSLRDDCLWHKQWSHALLQLALEVEPENRAVVQGWVNKWRPFVMRAGQALAPLFGEPHGKARQRTETAYRQQLESLGLRDMDGETPCP